MILSYPNIPFLKILGISLNHCLSQPNFLNDLFNIQNQNTTIPADLQGIQDEYLILFILF